MEVMMEKSYIHNGVPWFDQNGETVNAHGACLLKEGEKYYLFGEYKTDDVNKYIGFSCYSTENLSDWYFEGLALQSQNEGLLGPNRIGERPKVIKNHKTGKFVMLMHTDDLKYMDPCIGLATCDSIDGTFEFQGPLLFNGEPIRRWDMGTFVDEDGTAYLLIHEGDIYRLSDDYLTAVEKVAENIAPGGESPAMFRQDENYFIMFSNKTSWERNDNYYLVAKDLHGPWVNQGLFCPEGSLTYNSQCSFVFSLEAKGKNVPIYMGDRWSFPQQASSATQVWLPITVVGKTCLIPEYWPVWDSETISKVSIEGIEEPLEFQSNKSGESVSYTFNGSQVIVFGTSDCHSGYADFLIYDELGELIHTAVVDFYSLVSDSNSRYVSPKFPTGNYMLKVIVTGTNGVWYKKDGTKFGSDDFYVTLQRVKVCNED
ncbi:MAG: glycosyl hydrolase family 43 [Neobacillus sp.]|nr:glycosyl hydrolase family 43 [Neobacillus sp.]